MYKQKILVLTLSALLAALAACSRDAAPPAAAAKGPGPSPGVIPVPREFNGGTGYFAINGATKVRYSGGAGAQEAANYFVEQARANPELGLATPAEEGPSSKGISFEITAGDASLAMISKEIPLAEGLSSAGAARPSSGLALACSTK